MNCTECFCIAHHIAKRNESIHLILWWLLGPWPHVEIIENDVKSGIICLADITFNSHYLIYGIGICQSVAQPFNSIDNALQVFSSAVVIIEVHDHIPSSSLNDFPSQLYPSLLVLVRRCLCQQGLARKKTFPWHEASGIVLIIVEEVDRNTFLPQKVEQSAICPQTSKGIQFRNILNGNVSRLLLDFFIIFIHDNRRELQRIISALHDARIEQIETSFHSSSSISLI